MSEFANKKEAPPQTELNALEIHGIEFIAGLDAQIAKFAEALKPRLKSLPNGWRDFRLAQNLIAKALDGLYATMPTKTLLKFQRLNEIGEVILRPKPAVRKGQYMQIVDNDDLKLLINKTIEHECAICLRRSGEVRSCALRRALMSICPPEELVKDGSCNYQAVAAGNDLGQYI